MKFRKLVKYLTVCQNFKKKSSFDNECEKRVKKIS